LQGCASKRVDLKGLILVRSEEVKRVLYVVVILMGWPMIGLVCCWFVNGLYGVVGIGEGAGGKRGGFKDLLLCVIFWCTMEKKSSLVAYVTESIDC
jgi:hypothetical protein